ncbi:MAG: phosphohistidine phosphatase SixA [Deltaproteobacteria bacterium]|nr:MAG: phosphohistidine phosphatase SixA [Deltaproteobacteria bacterium]
MKVCHLYLFRHGIAEGEHPEHPGRDTERRLTDKGRERTARAALGLERLGIAPDVIWTSPYVRTRQTAQILAEVLDPSSGVEVHEQLACEGSNERLIEEIAGSAQRSVLLVGHEPNLSELTSLLVCGRGILRSRFKKAGYVHIEVHPVQQRVVGRLQAMLPPRVLRLLGGADDDERD